ncbi:uncharacterized protein Z520_11177 [Fonsecaea multimorphosa CBS 102226]|uniref:Uncharacterized protein n=1 Tax=Fonsecaea multimorphosa CBS 102226 TaxID=1442371 RepID=A0A0D2GUC2_9EURO|nr:uncharacterized protein Z520_11177 [Fonsecaea multimorphosa CBS 102226]KIX93120.1 hypothetical protein Z520_11177 [Fonsecaea multimorphosa CBS 102226]OAL18322.1 hypothetical protein AYO22_10738 [Fonsecaea multimorphosa]
MATFTVLDQAEEDKLHATRLLGIEERPFKRVSKRLLASTAPVNSFLARPSPSDDNVPAPELSVDQHEHFLQSLTRFREDVILDFAAFESSIARTEFLRAANTRERERYASEKLKIEQTANDVRENLSHLRVQLDEAQKTLAVRKTYDVLAEKITRDEKLKVTRAEQHVNLEKLKAEIEELERESAELKVAWGERREQFERVMQEGTRLRRVIRDEKEPEPEGEKDDADQEREREGDDGERERDGLSTAGTPRPIDDAPTPFPAGLRGSGGLTPRSNLLEGHASTGGATPQRPDEDLDMHGNTGVSSVGEDGIRDAAGAALENAADDMDTS